MNITRLTNFAAPRTASRQANSSADRSSDDEIADLRARFAKLERELHPPPPPKTDAEREARYVREVAAINFPFADLGLARRLGRAEGRANAEFVETRARLFPDSGASWLEVSGTLAMFDLPDSPLTQTFGLGLHEPPSPALLACLEEFFQTRGAPVFHEMCPLADLTLLSESGYRPVEFSNVMYRPLDSHRAGAARLIEVGEEDLWARTAAAGWGDLPGLSDLMAISVRCPGSRPFLAERAGRPVAAGMLHVHEGVSLLAGASTLPEARGQGAQRALLEARLADAAEQGAELAMVVAPPGSASQRNAERQGFRIAYTRVKWTSRPA